MEAKAIIRVRIAELRAALAKFPKDAPYTRNLLGVEYVEVRDYPAARDEFARVLEDMPHLSANHSNYGLTLVALGDDRTAEQELRLALALDSNNDKAKSILEALVRTTKTVTRREDLGLDGDHFHVAGAGEPSSGRCVFGRLVMATRQVD